MKSINEFEESEYFDADIISEIKLYFEHCYPRGLILVKKDAKFNYKKKIFDYIYSKGYKKEETMHDCYFNELMELLKTGSNSLDANDKKVVTNFLKINEFIKKQRQELDNYIKTLEEDK